MKNLFQLKKENPDTVKCEPTPAIEINLEEPSLSNYYIQEFTFRGLTYRSVSHAYEAFKFYDPQYGFVILDYKIKQILNAVTAEAAKAKSAEYSNEMVELSVQNRVRLVTEIMEAKFKSNPELAFLLLATNPNYLYEQNSTNASSDQFWGVSVDGIGENITGEILMLIREKLLAETQTPEES